MATTRRRKFGSGGESVKGRLLKYGFKPQCKMINMVYSFLHGMFINLFESVFLIQCYIKTNVNPYQNGAVTFTLDDDKYHKLYRFNGNFRYTCSNIWVSSWYSLSKIFTMIVVLYPK